MTNDDLGLTNEDRRQDAASTENTVEAAASRPSRQPSIVNRQSQRNIWRDGLWVGATAFVIITIGALYQTWLHLGPEGKAERAELKGDGVNVESYGFDLSSLPPEIQPVELVPTGERRNEAPVVDLPAFITVAQNNAHEGHDKYVLPTDRVIGIVHRDGPPKAYPIQVMQVHRIVNEEVGSDSWSNEQGIGTGPSLTIVYDPRTDMANGLLSGNHFHGGWRWNFFGNSGLSWSGVELISTSKVCAFTSDTEHVSREAIPLEFQQLVSPLAGNPLTVLNVRSDESRFVVNQSQLWLQPVNVLQWRDWEAMHPNTLILERDQALTQIYKKDLFGAYQLGERLPDRVQPRLERRRLAELGVREKSRGIGLRVAGEHGNWQDPVKLVFIPHEVVLANCTFDDDGLGTWNIELEDIALELQCRAADVGFTPSTVWTVNELPRGSVGLVMLFAWYATYPDTYMLQADGSLVKP